MPISPCNFCETSGLSLLAPAVRPLRSGVGGDPGELDLVLGVAFKCTANAWPTCCDLEISVVRLGPSQGYLVNVRFQHTLDGLKDQLKALMTVPRTIRLST